VLASPVIFYQAWRFVSPGLYLKERKLFLVFAAWSTFGFLAGMGVRLFRGDPFDPRLLPVVRPVGRGPDAVDAGIALHRTAPPVDLRRHVRTALVLFLAGRGGILAPASLRKWRKGAVLGAFLLAAVLTPPDAVSQIMVAFPLYALFEIGIVLCALGLAGAPRHSPHPPLESRAGIAYSSGNGGTSRPHHLSGGSGMIIECHTCHTRFRLDESRIRGKGARGKVPEMR